MARDHARIYVSIWGDDDWRKVSPLARYLYLAILSSPSLSYAGVTDWRTGRVAALVGMTEAQLLCAAAELVDRLYLVIDQETEEVLVRSFVRNDGLMKSPTMSVSSANAYSAVVSSGIRGVIVHELNRLQGDQPELIGWSKPQVKKVLAGEGVDPRSYPCGNPHLDPQVDPPVRGQVQNGVYPTPTPSPAPTPAPYSSSIESGGAPKSKRATARPPGFAPTQKHHALALERGVDLMQEFGKFCDWCDANGRTYKDWDAGFRTWLNRARPESQQRLTRQQETDGLFARASERLGANHGAQ